MAEKTPTPAAPAATQQAAAAAPAAATQQAKGRFTAVHGTMVHPFTGVVFNTDDSTKAEVDGWVSYQVKSGKLKASDD